MAVNNVNADYQKNLQRWQMMDDVCSGSIAVKSKGEKYLPVNCDCNEDGGKKRYEDYLKRAVFYPVTKETLQNDVGLAFSEDPTFEPDGMDFLKQDADGVGTSIYQLNQKALALLLKHGRGGFFVDHPVTDQGVTKADQLEKGIRPTIVLYDAKQIINWRVKKVGGVFKTSLIVLSEKTTQVDPNDEFNEIDVTIYRVLKLDDNNEYCFQVYSDATGQLLGSDLVYPTKYNGRKWNYIPFIPLGSQSNDFHIDEIPLEGLAEINLAHYRNSAEYENSVYICGQVQPTLTELSEDWRDFLFGNGMKLSSFEPLLLPTGAKFEFVSASMEMLAKDAMDEKKDYMESLGAKIREKSASVKTATQVDSEDAKQYSVLSLCVSNLNEASEYVLKWCAEYYGQGFEAKFSIKQDFARGELSLEDLKFWQSEVVAGRLSRQTFHEIKATGKVPEISYDEEQLRIEAEQNGTMNQG